MTKPMPERLRECVRIRSQLRDLLPDETEYGHLNTAMVHFVRDNIPASGKFRIPSLDRTLHFTLSTKHESYAVLKQ